MLTAHDNWDDDGLDAVIAADEARAALPPDRSWITPERRERMAAEMGCAPGEVEAYLDNRAAAVAYVRERRNRGSC